jgi:hypothetical protein
MRIRVPAKYHHTPYQEIDTGRTRVANPHRGAQTVYTAGDFSIRKVVRFGDVSYALYDNITGKVLEYYDAGELSKAKDDADMWDRRNK